MQKLKIAENGLPPYFVRTNSFEGIYYQFFLHVTNKLPIFQRTRGSGSTVFTHAQRKKTLAGLSMARKVPHGNTTGVD